ncbi:hypothetical protein J5N97_029402 [Dioscorea zingiberensis]|uniref:Pectinesterase n=1 Tax=Dioscorea zingiberensis TaxID=325984 RepID=A0A9D5C0N1_9LILI|nr:hypothetical protein J5N97_029402 [Dioscorea zingiberensis]
MRSSSSLLVLVVLLLLLLVLVPLVLAASKREDYQAVSLALEAVAKAKKAMAAVKGSAGKGECKRLYEESEERLRRVVGRDNGCSTDGLTWISAAMTGHGTCLEGLRERNVSFGTLVGLGEEKEDHVMALLRRALATQATSMAACGSGHQITVLKKNQTIHGMVMLEPWKPSSDKANIVVAQDGSGNHKSISEAITAVGRWPNRGNTRAVIYIKSGVYSEYINIDMKNIMIVGDGIDKTIITGNHNVPDGFTTFGSATFSVSGDGFWARDMTFENTAGPQKHQAVALMVASDKAVFYKCSFKGYQDTLYVHSQRQFFRDCDIYGTIDFIFGNSAAVLQNCNIYVRKPMDHQSNMITAQGRENPDQNTGISVHACRVFPDGDLKTVKGLFKSYLGRPWKQYSRTVFMKTDLDGMINPEGWARWDGDFAVNTLYYGEYMNSGDGADTSKRVNWPGFHVLAGEEEAEMFTVRGFVEGEAWIPESGVPFWVGV